MKKYLIIVGYSYMIHFGWYYEIAGHAPFHIVCNDEYSFVAVQTTGTFGKERWNQLLTKLSVKEGDEVVVYAHEANKENQYGCSYEILLELGYPFQLLHGEMPNKAKNFPFWLVTQISDYGLEKALNNSSWQEIVDNAKGSCPDGDDCERRLYKPS